MPKDEQLHPSLLLVVVRSDALTKQGIWLTGRLIVNVAGIGTIPITRMLLEKASQLPSF